MNRIRIDSLLVKKNLVNTRSQAKLLIEEGLVEFNGKVAKRAGQIVSDDSTLNLKRETGYVGRGALKLAAAVKKFKIDLNDKIAADIGACTGGFTDYLIQNGIKKVYAIDVGHGQLAEKLINNPKVINMEGINIKNEIGLPEKVDLAVADLSHISLKLTIKNIFNLIKRGGKAIILFKPQFEGGPEVLNKQGIIKDDEVRNQILNNFLIYLKNEKYKIIDTMKSPVKGKAGNIEYFIYFKN